MPHTVLVAVDRPEVAPLAISPRLRSQLIYFAEGDSPDATHLHFDVRRAAETLDDGVIALVSPLDTANMTEVELSEEQETLLSWLVEKGVTHARVEDR